ncbi:hypothetical protein GALMADRAFT_232270 [Galerina marginata CBS 339.88]|uniref:Uncharacterized protein n=1 Tax=Galerina marginata (strain CBS 339.88) TaxID=685588 RepID=A0A067S8C1_GALM3|nr:hypothetical protein GALMADRAFT_232270 [Galerina marginata CBS 339.88]
MVVYELGQQQLWWWLRLEIVETTVHTTSGLAIRELPVTGSLQHLSSNVCTPLTPARLTARPLRASLTSRTPHPAPDPPAPVPAAKRTNEPAISTSNDGQRRRRRRLLEIVENAVRASTLTLVALAVRLDHLQGHRVTSEQEGVVTRLAG